jgi:hypothetical protein
MGNTVVATSNDNSTTAATTTTMSQSNVQLNNGGDGDEDVSTINQDNFATGLVSTIIGRLFHNPMLHWWGLGGSTSSKSNFSTQTSLCLKAQLLYKLNFFFTE